MDYSTLNSCPFTRWFTVSTPKLQRSYFKRLPVTRTGWIKFSISHLTSLSHRLSTSFKHCSKRLRSSTKGLWNSIRELTPINFNVSYLYLAGILSEIGTITAFSSNDKLAKYAGLTWRVKQSGPYTADVTRMTKTGNKYLRYYLIEAANKIACLASLLVLKCTKLVHSHFKQLKKFSAGALS